MTGTVLCGKALQLFRWYIVSRIDHPQRLEQILTQMSVNALTR